VLSELTVRTVQGVEIDAVAADHNGAPAVRFQGGTLRGPVYLTPRLLGDLASTNTRLNLTYDLTIEGAALVRLAAWAARRTRLDTSAAGLRLICAVEAKEIPQF
jgi:hypothetical protein